MKISNQASSINHQESSSGWNLRVSPFQDSTNSYKYLIWHRISFFWSWNGSFSIVSAHIYSRTFLRSPIKTNNQWKFPAGSMHIGLDLGNWCSPWTSRYFGVWVSMLGSGRNRNFFLVAWLDITILRLSLHSLKTWSCCVKLLLVWPWRSVGFAWLQNYDFPVIILDLYP